MKFYGREFLKKVKPLKTPDPKTWKWQPSRPDLIRDASELVPTEPWVRAGGSKFEKPEILILGRRDPQIGCLLKELLRIEANFLYVDLDHLAFHSGISIRIEGQAELMLGHHRVPLKQVRKVYYSVPQFDVVLTDGSQRFSDDERLCFARWMQALEQLALVIPEKKWIPGVPSQARPESQRRYEDLRSAQDLGLKVPETLITNSQEELIQFVKKHRGQVVFRETAFRFPQMERKSWQFQIRKVDIKSKDMKWLPESPCVFQQYVEKGYEWRVLIIDEQILACRIDSQSSAKSKFDWKEYDFANVRFEARSLGPKKGDLPATVAQQLLHLRQQSRLRFATFDLVETPKGDWFFLEMNRPGQWLFIEALSGLEIARALSLSLVARK